MKTKQYILKISPQGQVTIPTELRSQLKVSPGSKIVARSAANGALVVDNRLPIQKYLGSLGNSITGGRDAADYIRKMRDEDNRHRQSTPVK